MKMFTKKQKAQTEASKLAGVFFPKKCACMSVRIQMLGMACEYCSLQDLLAFKDAVIKMTKEENYQIKRTTAGLKEWVKMHSAICTAKLPEGREDELNNKLNVFLQNNVTFWNRWPFRLFWWHCWLPMKRLDQDFRQCRWCRYVALTASWKRIKPRDIHAEGENKPQPGISK